MCVADSWLMDIYDKMMAPLNHCIQALGLKSRLEGGRETLMPLVLEVRNVSGLWPRSKMDLVS